MGIAFLLLAASACGGGSSQAPHPAGWTPIASSPGDQVWGNGAVAPGEAQRYESRSEPFAGQRQDLASREAIRAAMRYPHAHFQSSVPFPGCEGLAGLMTFQLQGGGILEEAFAVRDGNAVTVSYVYPKGATPSADVPGAMRATVCVLPG